jgi:GTP cyclohydrolase I
MKLTAVGVEKIHCPIQIREKGRGRQSTVADLSLRANMPSETRETCLTAVSAIIKKYQDDINPDIFPLIVEELRTELQADAAQIEMTFPYFIAKQAPITKTSSLMEYTCKFTCQVSDKQDFTVSVWVPSTTLCPCSKEISSFGAHNQRAEINLNVKFNKFIWLEDLIALVESGSSCEVYSLLKRPDEKYVTEKAYENPMFVEDVVRKVAELAMEHEDISWFSVGVESFESIHKHSAYAYTDSEAINA